MVANRPDDIDGCEYGCNEPLAAALMLHCQGEEQWYGRCEHHWNSFLDSAGETDLDQFGRACEKCREVHFFEAAAIGEGQRSPYRMEE